MDEWPKSNTPSNLFEKAFRLDHMDSQAALGCHCLH